MGSETRVVATRGSVTPRFLAQVRDIPDFPTPGILFKDITPALADPDGLAEIVEGLAELVDDRQVDRVLAVEARGFLLAAPVAYRLGAGLVLVRKAGKLPSAVEAEPY